MTVPVATPASHAPSTRSTLLRQEVARARQQQWLGQIVLARPISLLIMTSVALAIAIALCLLLAWGKYTRKETVTGHIILSRGTAKVYSPVTGTVLARLVKEGDRVVKGQALYTVSSERSTSSKGNIQAEISQQLAIRRQSLTEELAKQQTLLIQEEQALRRRIEGSQAELRQLDQELKTRQERLDLATGNLSRFQELARQNYVSAAGLRDHEREVLTLRGEREAALRNRLSLQKDIASLEAELGNAPLKGDNLLAATRRALAELEQLSLDNEAQREINVVSQVDGTVTALLVNIGQTVAQSTALLGILPAGSSYEARLFVPSRAIGFIKPGSVVDMRYDAFPYQKFGQHRGAIKDISRTALSPAELQLLGTSTEAFYPVTVALDSPKVQAYGESVELQDGMQLEADIQIDTRRLYEWVLEPLYTLVRRY